MLTKQYFPYAGLSLEKIGARLRDKRFKYFVALYNSHSVGYVDLHMRGKTCKILGLAVLPEFRGFGVGTKLLQSAMKEGRKRGATRLVLLTTEGNSARGLYERMGFVKKGRLKKKLWGHEVIVMEYRKGKHAKTPIPARRDVS